jgi:uncharacterized protein (TIGR02118 family)
MVKLTCFLRRRPGMTAEDFDRHWREVHGPLIAGLPTLARHVVRYEQHPRLSGSDAVGTPGYDGVAVQWFRSLEEFMAFVSEPDYARHVAPDEGAFLDRAGLVWMLTEEPRVVIGGTLSD